MLKRLINLFKKIIGLFVKSDRQLWAEKEVAIACEKGGSPWGICDYYMSALKAYNSLLRDNHSELSFIMTKKILDRLMEGLPLTPIYDIPEIWGEAIDVDGVQKYQCKRMSSLFKTVIKNKAVFSDVNRTIGYYKSGESFNGGGITPLVDKMFPITMPYYPPLEKYKVEVEDLENDKGIVTRHFISVTTPDGKKNTANSYLKFEGDKTTEIDKKEYEKLNTILH